MADKDEASPSSFEGSNTPTGDSGAKKENSKAFLEPFKLTTVAKEEEDEETAELNEDSDGDGDNDDAKEAKPKEKNMGNEKRSILRSQSMPANYLRPSLRRSVIRLGASPSSKRATMAGLDRLNAGFENGEATYELGPRKRCESLYEKGNRKSKVENDDDKVGEINNDNNAAEERKQPKRIR